MNASACTIVIIGAGHAGGRTAQALREAGFDGTIRMFGAERHLPYERPPLSKGVLVGDIDVGTLSLAGAPTWREQGIDIEHDCPVVRVHPAGRRIELMNGRYVGYDYLVIATGGRPRRLQVPGAHDADLLYLRDIDDALAIRARLVAGTRLCVIGGGVIGLEVAASARRLGVEVVVIEAAGRLLGRVAPPTIGTWMAQLHRQQGVELMLGEPVASLARRGGASVVRTASGRHVEADAVVVGVGIVPNVEPLGGASSEAAQGIVVDDCGRSADPRIFAVGDVARTFDTRYGVHLRSESWRNAESQGRAVAAAILRQPVPRPPVPWMWTDQYDVNLQVAGIVPAQDVQWVTRGRIQDRKFTLLGLVGKRVVAGCSVNQGRDMRFVQQLITGGHAVEAAELADASLPLSTLLRPVTA